MQAYREWSRIKAITEAAVRNLRDVDPPAKAAKWAREERWLEVRGDKTGQLRTGARRW